MDYGHEDIIREAPIELRDILIREAPNDPDLSQLNEYNIFHILKKKQYKNPMLCIWMDKFNPYDNLQSSACAFSLIYQHQIRSVDVDLGEKVLRNVGIALLKILRQHLPKCVDFYKLLSLQASDDMSDKGAFYYGFHIRFVYIIGSENCFNHNDFPQT